MYVYRLASRWTSPLLVVALALPLAISAQQIPSPEEFFGHRMGADRQLAGWEELVEYYELIDERSEIGRASCRERV